MKTKWIILIVVSIVALATALYFIFIYPYIPKYNWEITYLMKSKEPYGCKIFSEVLESNNPDVSYTIIDKSVAKQLDTKAVNSCYVFVGQDFLGEESDVDTLMTFVKNGNIAFVASDRLPERIWEKIFADSITVQTDSIQKAVSALKIQTHFIGKNSLYLFRYQYLKKISLYDWSYYDTVEVKKLNKNSKALTIFNDKYTDYLVMTYGRGKFYFHCNPIVFTNYNIHTKTGFEYTNSALSFISKRNLYWDESSKKSDGDNNIFNHVFDPNESPLRYLLAQKSFRWAWYLMLSLMILFIFIGIKRKQRPIPLLEKNKNSSMDYVRAVSSMYYETKNHKFIAEEMWKLFQTFVKIKYNLELIHLDETEKDLLSEKSTISIELITALFELQKLTVNSNYRINKDLLKFHQAILNFHKNCK